MNKEEYIKRRKILTRSIGIMIYITFVCFNLGGIQSIADWNYNVHEMLYMPLNIAFFIVPILIIVWFYYAIKSYGYKKDSITNKVKLYAKNFIITMSLVLIVIYFVIQFHSVSTGGVFRVNAKVHEGNKYYIVLNKTKVKCTWNEYNLTELGKSYLIQYKWNTYWPNKGELDQIQPVPK
jgi:hypothetical protein